MGRKILASAIGLVLAGQVAAFFYLIWLLDPAEGFIEEYSGSTYDFLFVYPLVIAIVMSTCSLAYGIGRLPVSRSVVGSVNAGWLLLWLGLGLFLPQWTTYLVLAPYYLGCIFAIWLALVFGKRIDEKRAMKST